MPPARAKDKETPLQPGPQVDPAMKFEAAMAELEQIVGEMEEAEMPLESLLERYERGVKLAQLCDLRLAEAEQKVEIVTAGSPPPPQEKGGDPEEADPDEDENEARLF